MKILEKVKEGDKLAKECIAFVIGNYWSSEWTPLANVFGDMIWGRRHDCTGPWTPTMSVCFRFTHISTAFGSDWTIDVL